MRKPFLCNMRTTKVQISLQICAFWSAPLFRCLDSIISLLRLRRLVWVYPVANSRRQVFSWCGSYTRMLIYSYTGMQAKVQKKNILNTTTTFISYTIRWDYTACIILYESTLNTCFMGMSFIRKCNVWLELKWGFSYHGMHLFKFSACPI